MEQLRWQLASPALGGVLFGVAAGAWFAYFRLKERRAKPFGLMLGALLGGWVAAFASVLAFSALDSVGLVADWCVLQAGGKRGLSMSLLAAGVEESAKLIPTLAVVLLGRRHLNRGREALFVAALAGVGFAAAESMFLCEQGLPLLESLARAITSPVTHALFAAPAGLGAGRLVLGRRAWALPVGLAASVAAHAAYNLLLAAEVPLAVPAFLVLALWLWLLFSLTPVALPSRPGAAR